MVELERGDGSLMVGKVAAPLHERTAAVLREAILDFRLHPGQRLIERELIEQMGVSRTTIREVLRQLTAEGLVVIIPQRGAVVVELTPKEAKDLYEVRAMLEALAARLFAERASDEQVAQLRAAVEEMRQGIKEAASKDQWMQSLIDVKDRYYEVFLEGSGNTEIRSVLVGLHARVRLLRATSLSQLGRLQQTLVEIDAVIGAIERRDADGAAAFADYHVQQAAFHGLKGLADARHHKVLDDAEPVLGLRA